MIYWGPDLVVLYNDAYAEILGKKHPTALGRPCREVWSEIWDVIGPMLDRVLTLGDATWSEDQLLLLERRGYPEECYFSFSFSPVRGANGAVDGIFTAVIENTGRVLGERRLRTLRDLGASLAEATSAEKACSIAASILADNSADVPYALFYLTDQQTRRGTLVATAGGDSGIAAAPASFELDYTRGRRCLAAGERLPLRRDGASWCVVLIGTCAAAGHRKLVSVHDLHCPSASPVAAVLRPSNG